eukprot:9317807-Pyramimonas_sp.AAC.1
MSSALDNLTKLREEAEAHDSCNWHIVYKYHFFEHLSQLYDYINPRIAWTFKAEDIVGKMSGVAHSCSFGVRSIDLPGKVVMKWRRLYTWLLNRRSVDL